MNLMLAKKMGIERKGKKELRCVMHMRQAYTMNAIVTYSKHGLIKILKRRQWLAEWINKLYDPTVCYLQEIDFISKDTHSLIIKGFKATFQANRNQKTAE